uniref:Uncharacterized protein n=1 Tax=Musa acuminata subsp. malaccensis TaxID=214687 RepID=A0A804K170_MUSAM
MRKVLSTMFL